MTQRTWIEQAGRKIRNNCWKPALALIIYLVLIWVLPKLVNADGVRRMICAQAGYVLGTDVEIERVEVELKILGGWRLRLRNVQVVNPSPDFGLEEGDELFTARKIVFEGQLWDLLRGRWRPQVLVKGWVLQVSRSLLDNRINLTALFLRQGAAPQVWEDSFFGLLKVRSQSVELQEGRIFFKDVRMGRCAWIARSALLQGQASFMPARRDQQKGARLKVEFSGQPFEHETESFFRCQAELRDFLMAREGLRGRWQLTLEGASWSGERLQPLFRLPQSLSRSSLESGQLVLEGSLGRAADWTFQQAEARVHGFDVPELGIRSGLRFAVRRAAGSEGRLAGRIGDLDGGQEATYRLISAGTHYRLELQSDRFQLQAGHLGPPWLRGLFSRLQELRVSTKSYQLLNLSGAEAALSVHLKEAAPVSLALDGAFCGGRLQLSAAGIPTVGSRPAFFRLQIAGAEAPALAQMLAPYTPEPWRFFPAEGKLSMILAAPARPSAPVADETGLVRRLHRFCREDADWAFLLRVDEPLRFLEPGDSSILQALWKTPERLAALQREFQSGTTISPAPLGALQLNSGILLVENGPRALGEFACSELGPLRLEWINNSTGGALRLRMHPLRTVAPTTGGIDPDQWLPSFLQVARSVERSRGLEWRIEPEQSGRPTAATSTRLPVRPLWEAQIRRAWQAQSHAQAIKEVNP